MNEIHIRVPADGSVVLYVGTDKIGNVMPLMREATYALSMIGDLNSPPAVLHSATPGNDYCNGVIAPIQDVRAGACLCDCLHVDDLAEILKEKGLDKRPKGK